MFIKPAPKVSVLIPVYGTERYFAKCLESVAAQDFEGIEIIAVDDGSPVSPAGSAEKIVKDFKKRHKKQISGIKLIKHGTNRGLVEARRTALYEASGDYIMFVDSDDILPCGAVKALFEAAEQTDADIVQGRIKVYAEGNFEVEFASQASRDSSLLEGVAENEERLERGEGFPLSLKKRIDDMDKKANKVFSGTLEDRAILDGFLVNANHCGFLWGKIFTRKLCLEAFEQIPPVWCTMGEDFLTYFFLALFANKYAGIEETVYCYNADTGISSDKTIWALEEWEKVCSTAGVFTVLLSWIEENTGKITDEQADSVRGMCRWYAANNLAQLESAVVPKLRQDAYRMLCDYWGENMIEGVKGEDVK